MANDLEQTPPIIVIGGSAGAHEPLLRIVAQLPPDLAAYLLVVIHIPTNAVSNLPHIIARSGSMFAAHALDGAPLQPHRIIVAPPDFHLTVVPGFMHVRTGAKENGHRPSIDVLFRSAAQSFGSRALGILLSGTLDDGVDGLRSIRLAGGMTMVQEPDEASFPNMPSSAIEAGVVDVVSPVDEIARRISEFASNVKTSEAFGSPNADERDDGRPSIFTCPDCGGTLWELDVDDDMRFRCRTGHAYSPGSMLSLQSDNVEHALWAAIRALQERTDLLRKLAVRANLRGEAGASRRFDERAAATGVDIESLQNALDEIMSRPRIAV